MAAKLDRVVIALIFLVLFILSLVLYFFVQDKLIQIGLLCLTIVSSGGFGYSLARIIVRR
jgi:hypothetical protein